MDTATETTAAELKACFANLVDPRNGYAQVHELLDMIIIAICASMCGADQWTEVEAFGKAKLAWWSTFLALPGGIPSHDTFGRLFRYLHPEALESGFRQRTAGLRQRIGGEVIPIDGKCLRGSHGQGLGKDAIYKVSAWASENRLVLGQSQVDAMSNEITAIPELLRKLDVAGCIVSINAIGTQKDIAAQIVAQEDDYMLALKGNQPHLHEDVQSLFTWADNREYEAIVHAYHKDTHKGHGRLEIRECWTISDPSCIAMLAGRED